MDEDEREIALLGLIEQISTLSTQVNLVDGMKEDDTHKVAEEIILQLAENKLLLMYHDYTTRFGFGTSGHGSLDEMMRRRDLQ